MKEYILVKPHKNIFLVSHFLGLLGACFRMVPLHALRLSSRHTAFSLLIFNPSVGASEPAGAAGAAAAGCRQDPWALDATTPARRIPGIMPGMIPGGMVPPPLMLTLMLMHFLLVGSPPPSASSAPPARWHLVPQGGA